MPRDRSEGGSISGSRSPLSSAPDAVDQTAGLPRKTPSTVGVSQAAETFDPFCRGFLSLETGQELLDYFKTKMTPYFPFAVLSDQVSIRDLVRNRPCTCLAVLAAASHERLKLQRALGGLLNELIASRVATAPIHSLDMLQGLLINVAW